MNKNFPYPSKFYCPKNHKTHRHIFGQKPNSDKTDLETRCTLCDYKQEEDIL